MVIYINKLWYWELLHSFVSKDFPCLSGTRSGSSRASSRSLDLNSTWQCITSEPYFKPYFLVVNKPESTVLIKSTISASFQANSITKLSSKSLPYNLPHSICPKYTSLRSASDRLICSGGSFFRRGAGSIRSASHASTTLRLVLVIRTVPAAPIPSSRS